MIFKQYEENCRCAESRKEKIQLGPRPQSPAPIPKQQQDRTKVICKRSK